MFRVEGAQALNPACEAEDNGFGEGQTGAHKTRGGFGSCKDEFEIVCIRKLERVLVVSEEY